MALSDIIPWGGVRRDLAWRDDPFNQLRRQINRVFDDAFSGGRWPEGEGTVFAPQLDQVNSIQGPLFINGGTITMTTATLSDTGANAGLQTAKDLPIGFGVVEVLGRAAGGTLVFAGEKEEPLLGVTVLESTGLWLDPQHERLMPRPPKRKFTCPLVSAFRAERRCR